MTYTDDVFDVTSEPAPSLLVPLTSEPSLLVPLAPEPSLLVPLVSPLDEWLDAPARTAVNPKVRKNSQSQLKSGETLAELRAIAEEKRRAILELVEVGVESVESVLADADRSEHSAPIRRIRLFDLLCAAGLTDASANAKLRGAAAYLMREQLKPRQLRALPLSWWVDRRAPQRLERLFDQLHGDVRIVGAFPYEMPVLLPRTRRRAR